MINDFESVAPNLSKFCRAAPGMQAARGGNEHVRYPSKPFREHGIPSSTTLPMGTTARPLLAAVITTSGFSPTSDQATSVS